MAKYKYLYRDNVVPEKSTRSTFLSLNMEAVPTTLYVRENQKNTSPQFQKSFLSAIEQLIESGSYSRLVNIHADMSHRMHTMRGMGPVGSLRFLPWHRAYLQKLEIELRVIDPKLYIPYWDWTVDQQIPDWLSDFTPDGVTDSRGRPIQISREPGNQAAPTLPSKSDISAVQQNKTYLDYTLALEGARPYGAHNQVHVWVGGTMSQVPVAPADPIFWMHHCFCDKLWHEWQIQNPDQYPKLAGSDGVLDPWPDTVTDVESIKSLGYEYK
jgi:tyrosinase